MSIQSKQEYLISIRERYFHSTKKKKLILDEFCVTCGYHRKYAIRLLHKPSPHHRMGKAGRRKHYDNRDVFAFLFATWKMANLPYAKRLKAMITLCLPSYQQLHGALSTEVIDLLTTISTATIDRLLAPVRLKYAKRGLATTKPGSLLKHHIPIKTNQWEETIPGFIEADTVAHCGTSVAGMFVYTVNIVDIATGWTEQRVPTCREARANVVFVMRLPKWNTHSRFAFAALMLITAANFSTGICSNILPRENNPSTIRAHGNITKTITRTLKEKTGRTFDSISAINALKIPLWLR